MTDPSYPAEAPEISFRLMRLEDIPRVRQIDVLSFSLPWPEKSYRFELTENPASLALVAEIVPPGAPTLVIGMSVVWIVVDEAHIATIAIHPDFRDHGYGKRLLAETLRRSILRGAALATLEVRLGNLAARQMYLEFGFSVVGRRVHYYHDNNEDALIMTLADISPQYRVWLEELAHKA